MTTKRKPAPKSRSINPVCFNLEDEYEADLLAYALAQQKFFSRYVKRLIERDRSGLQSAPNVIPTIITEVFDDAESDMSDAVGGFL